MARDGQGDTGLIAVLQNAVKDSGLSLNQVAKDSGVSQGQLSRFVRGERMLSLVSAAKLFDYFGLTVVHSAEEPEPDPPPAKKPKKR